MSRAHWRPVLILTVALAAVTAAPATAQRGTTLTGSIQLTSLVMRSVAPTGHDEVHGPIFGGEASLGVEFLSLRLGYARGLLADDPGTARDLWVEGFGLLGVRPVTGLEVTIGPFIRSRVIDAVRERLVVWRVRARYEAPIVMQAVQGYVEATAGKPNWTPELFTQWWGGAVGLLIRPRDGVFAVGASYTIDEARVRGGARRETVEGLTLTVSAYLR
jgi:hypothetical protein